MWTVALAFVLSLMLISTTAAETLDDPYAIILANLIAEGGCPESATPITSFYLEGKFEDCQMGREGRVEMWYRAPSLSREVVSFPNFAFQSGDNGRYQWQGFDSLISMTQGSVALVRRYLDSLLLENEYLKRDSKIYEATYSGLTECEPGVCYVVTLTNSLNSDTLIHFFDTVSFVTRRTINVEGETRFSTTYDDFRLGDGILRAFLIKETIEPGGGCYIIRLEQVKLNIDIPDSLFEPPYPIRD